MAYSLEDKLLIVVSASALEAALPLAGALSAMRREGDIGADFLVISREGGSAVNEIFKSAMALKTDIIRCACTGGAELAPYLKALGADLFLSDCEEDVQSATDAGLCAALLYPCAAAAERAPALRFAFDADAVLFEDSELSRMPSLAAFSAHEAERARIPLPDGPFAAFYRKLCRVRDMHPALGLRLALISSRSAPSHERVMNTLEGWGALPDECFFLGGIDKAGIVQLFSPDMYFDDMHIHIESSAALVPCARVLYRK